MAARNPQSLVNFLLCLLAMCTPLSQGLTHELTAENFSSVFEREKFVLLQIYQPRCISCRQLSSAFHEVAKVLEKR